MLGPKRPELEPKIIRSHSVEAAGSDEVSETVRGRMDRGQVESVRQLAALIAGGARDVTAYCGCAASEQRDRSLAVASPGMRQADGDLG